MYKIDSILCIIRKYVNEDDLNQEKIYIRIIEMIFVENIFEIIKGLKDFS
jgi:hypothetical protein